MKNLISFLRKFCLLFFIIIFFIPTYSHTQQRVDLRKKFFSPPPSASPWVFWYWMQAAVSKEGITADLEAMKEVGIAGAYLMPIKGAANPPLVQPAALQLTPYWWELINHAFKEARRLGIKLGLHYSDGFALGGGPWITPELSMQKIVWTQKNISGGKLFDEILEQPKTREGYYKDIAVFAFPSMRGAGISTKTIIPKISSSMPDSAVQLLIVPGNKKNFSSDENCWIQYEFEQPFTCRSIVIGSKNNYQSNRLIVQVSDDGKNFRNVKRLEPPRHGWQDDDENCTHSIPATTAKYFRFIYDKEGSEPGSEDLDAAKWKPSLKLFSLELSSEARLNQFEGKNGSEWRISKWTSEEQITDDDCVRLRSIMNITNKLDKNGRLHWNVPPGNWTILRIGHTSTGHKNETAGGGKGLECDKFNPAAVTLQFNKWFGEFYHHIDAATIKDVLKFFHVDSWECGSQNWTTNFLEEFRKRRGYDLFQYLPVMTGVPIESSLKSEQILHDVRQTIAELVNDKFFVTLARLAGQKGVEFSAESVAPTMESDGMLHYKSVNIPMGEFWLRSPTHDKPNDLLDAISGAHIYGKNIVQAEAFTELRMAWDEYPGMLKTLADRNFALGINRLVYHVFVHNPWLNKKPGMTLDPIGLYFQRDQTWWKQSNAWVDYAKRCQALLQLGKPVVDIAIFTGEELPRRAILPDRLVSTLPGIFGKEIVERESTRLANHGQPLIQSPQGVTHSANITDASDWIDPLHGYAYDSYNIDALQNYSTVKNGKISLPNGAGYSLLVIPRQKNSVTPGLISLSSSKKIGQLVEAGATLLMVDSFSLVTDGNIPKNYDKHYLDALNNYSFRNITHPGDIVRFAKGKIIVGPYEKENFSEIGLQPDFLAADPNGMRADEIAWTHRRGNDFDIYFISNQEDSARVVNLSLRITGRIPELWNPVTGEISIAKNWQMENGRTHLPVQLDRNGSLFIVLQQSTSLQQNNSGKNWREFKLVSEIDETWTVKFDEQYGGPKNSLLFDKLTDWSQDKDLSVRYYSGTSVYSKKIKLAATDQKLFLDLGEVRNIAEVFVNGIPCGIAWTYPYRVDISKAVKPGDNEIKIAVTNTWANRMIGDSQLPTEKRITNTIYPFKMEGKPLLPAGLFGPVVIESANF
jgi:hypothetical protein